MRTYYAMLTDRGDPDAVGKMKQFASYFTHGVRNGARLRAEIYHAQGAARRSSTWWTSSSTGELAARCRMKKVQLITDGACMGNPGPGGWAAILRYNQHMKEILRLRAADHQQPHGTDAPPSKGSARSKSPAKSRSSPTREYVKNGITELDHNWKRNGWMTADKKPVMNQDLWEELDEQAARTRPRGPGPRATPPTTTTTAATNWPAQPPHAN